MNRTLALIEPDLAVRDAITRLLRVEKWQVRALEQGEALQPLLESQDLAAVISEFSLPDVTPNQLLELCRGRGVPVIFTGHNFPLQGAVDVIKLGALDFLEKPFSRTRLLDLLSDLPCGQNGPAAPDPNKETGQSR